MKTFKSRRAEMKFTEILEALPTKYARDSYTEKVKALRDDKVTSEDGKYTEFLVTEKELINLASQMIVRA